MRGQRGGSTHARLLPWLNAEQVLQINSLLCVLILLHDGAQRPRPLTVALPHSNLHHHHHPPPSPLFPADPQCSEQRPGKRPPYQPIEQSQRRPVEAEENTDAIASVVVPVL